MALPVVRSVRTVRPVPLFLADLDRQFDQVARAFFGPQSGRGRPVVVRRGWAPVVDVATSDEAYTLTVELPGLKRDQIRIELADGTLTVRGEYGSTTEKADQPDEGSDQADEGSDQAHEGSERADLPVERPATRRSGHVEVRRALPADVERDGVTASLADGVLTVTLPRVAKPAARQIEIDAA